ncbi:MAG: group 1 glycosyl transferase [Planktothrix sp. GU0601_MAG3]|nr:MAG: group 1 glycosyl transferase [Planktothrix sp. GU0601_MAG3]
MMNLILEGDEQLETQPGIRLISPENFEEWFNAILTVNYKILGSNVNDNELNEWLKIIPSVSLEKISNSEKYQLLSTVNEEQKIFKLQLANQCFHAQRFTEAANLGRNLLSDYPELVEIGFSIPVAHSLILSLNWYEIAANLPPGINYLLTSGWLNSLYQSKPVTQDNRPIPWYTYPAIEFLEDKVKPDFKVFEFGSGQSTLWWSERVLEVISIENDLNWFQEINSKMPNNVQLFLKENETEYAEMIKQFPLDYFDVIIVDGVNRNQSLELSLNHIKEAGLIIFDNSDHYEYDESVNRLTSSGYKRIDFWGMFPGYTYKNCTSFFFKKFDILEAQQVSQW